MPANPNKLSRFWQELVRRKVIHVVVVYASVAFVIIELITNVSEPLRLPEWMPTAVILILIVVFPVTVILSWFFDLSFKGFVKTEAIEQNISVRDRHSHASAFKRFDHSIAVLPFQDISPENDQEYFCDGITEEIIHALARVESLKVIARTSAFAFKNKQEDIRKIGQDLNVETLLEGSIRKHGKQLRITAQLINVADGFHIWSEVYSRDLEDVFAIQEEISLAIVKNLRIKLLDNGAGELVSLPRVDSESYDLLLLAQHFQRKGSKQSMTKAIEYYKQVIKRAPDNAQAYAGLATCHTLLGFWNHIPPKSAFKKAKETAQKSVELDPGLPQAHSSLGLIQTYSGWEWENSENEYRKAIELSPNFADAFTGLSLLYLALGRLDESLLAGSRALELDPLSVPQNISRGTALLRMGRIQEARKNFSRSLELEPSFAEGQWLLGQSYILEGKSERGISEIKKALEQLSDSAVILSGLGWACGVTGRRKEAEEILAELELRSKVEYIRPYLLAKVYASLGRNDLAFQSLNQAFEKDDVSLVYILCDETMNPLRDDLRFDRILQRLRLKPTPNS